MKTLDKGNIREGTYRLLSHSERQNTLREVLDVLKDHLYDQLEFILETQDDLTLEGLLM